LAIRSRPFGKLAALSLLPCAWALAAQGAPASGVPASGAPPANGAPPGAAVAATVAARPAVPPGGRQNQAESDDYTRYELLPPDTAQFHILYEVTATIAGATTYFNPIRKGSEASGEAIYDRATGKALSFAVVSGEEARRSGLPDATLDSSYLRIQLARPVPAVGGVRLLIDKTYKDPKSYYRKGDDRIVFARGLGIRRNAIVLPAGYELVACNMPSQVLPEADGRTRVSFMHTGPEAAPLELEARRLPGVAAAASASAPPGDASAAGGSPMGAGAAGARPAAGAAPAAAPARESERLVERAHQDRTIVYFLRQPESHAFDLYHDYTESREGTDKYLNVVRKGSAASSPSALDLDTGEPLRVETLRGEALRRAGLTAAELAEIADAGGGGKGGTAAPAPDIAPDTEVVIARFAPVHHGESIRLRIAETYTDPRSYRLDGERLVFDRSFGRPRDAVVLPAGWYLTANAIPALISETADGRIRLDFVNPRPDEIDVLIEARRRPPG